MKEKSFERGLGARGRKFYTIGCCLNIDAIKPANSYTSIIDLYDYIESTKVSPCYFTIIEWSVKPTDENAKIIRVRNANDFFEN